MKQLYPDEIFIDAENLPGFDVSQMEGHIERPISRRVCTSLALLFALVLMGYVVRLVDLQAVRGGELRERSEENRLRAEVIPADRGTIFDRTGTRLAWNGPDARAYKQEPGFGHLVGFVGLPSRDDIVASTTIPLDAAIGKAGIEREEEFALRGNRGSRLVEINSLGAVVSRSTERQPLHGDDVTLTVDWRVQSRLYRDIERAADEYGWRGGAGVIMDVETGELLARTSFPELNSNALVGGASPETVAGYFDDPREPFLNRAVAGLYAPGSTVKPIVALAALGSGTIDPRHSIYSSGKLVVPNPFSPDQPSVFKDWKAHGWVAMREAIAVSSNVYFYTIGGGFGDVPGVGIRRLGDYFGRFGLGSGAGMIPSPERKKQFEGEDAIWRVGDTYNASIGQGYFEVTPLQMVAYAAALATRGTLPVPHVVLGEKPQRTVVPHIPKAHYNVVREGMRRAVTDGTARGLSLPWLEVAAKTGTAEADGAGRFIHSWVIGFFPYEDPRYAFAVLLERGAAGTSIGAPAVMRELLDWMFWNTPEYLL